MAKEKSYQEKIDEEAARYPLTNDIDTIEGYIKIFTKAIDTDIPNIRKNECKSSVCRKRQDDYTNVFKQLRAEYQDFLAKLKKRQADQASLLAQQNAAANNPMPVSTPLISPPVSSSPQTNVPTNTGIGIVANTPNVTAPDPFPPSPVGTGNVNNSNIGLNTDKANTTTTTPTQSKQNDLGLGTPTQAQPKAEKPAGNNNMLLIAGIAAVVVIGGLLLIKGKGATAGVAAKA